MTKTPSFEKRALKSPSSADSNVAGENIPRPPLVDTNMLLLYSMSLNAVAFSNDLSEVIVLRNLEITS